MAISKKKNDFIEVALALLLVGSLWGMAEMTLGGFLHAIHLPQKGVIMGGIAVSLMAFFVTLTRKPLLVPVLGVIAALFKPFSALIFGVPVFSPFIVNPSIAIILEATAFSAVAAIAGKTLYTSIHSRLTAGFFAGGMGIIFYAVVATTFGLGMWQTFNLTTAINTALITALPVAAVGAFTMLLGHFAGKTSLPGITLFRIQHPGAYYSAVMTVTVICWAIPVIFKAGI